MSFTIKYRDCKPGEWMQHYNIAADFLAGDVVHTLAERIVRAHCSDKGLTLPCMVDIQITARLTVIHPGPKPAPDAPGYDHAAIAAAKEPTDG